MLEKKSKQDRALEWVRGRLHNLLLAAAGETLPPTYPPPPGAERLYLQPNSTHDDHPCRA